MSTQCTPIQLEFPRVGHRRVVARFNGGAITSNAGALLLRAVESCTQVCRRAARCFQDHRDGRWVEHTVEELVTQRVVGLALGYEDVNDHDTLHGQQEGPFLPRLLPALLLPAAVCLLRRAGAVCATAAGELESVSWTPILLGGGGIRDAEDEAAVPGGIPAADGRAGSVRTDAGRVSSRVRAIGPGHPELGRAGWKTPAEALDDYLRLIRE